MRVPPQGLSPLVSVDSNGNTQLLNPNGTKLVGIDNNGNTSLYSKTGSQLFYINTAGNVYMTGNLAKFTGRNTALNGLTSLRGSDIRTGVTATDASAITLFTNPSASVQTFRVTCSLIGNSGTISSAVYTLSYTDANSVVISQTVSISAVSTEATTVHLFQVKGSTAITGQLTTLSGTSPAVDISCIVEGVSTGT